MSKNLLCWNILSPLLLQLPPSSHGVDRCHKNGIHNPYHLVKFGEILHNMKQMPIFTRCQQAPCAQLWWGMQGLDGARNELCPPSPDVLSLQLQPAAELAWGCSYQGCVLCSCTGTDACSFQSCHSCTLHKH